ncbi:hypothetical protein Landi51_11383 [Colletotrichum acutatum]
MTVDGSNCPEDNNSTDCLLRSLMHLLNEQKKAEDNETNWDPITFFFTLPVESLATTFAVTTVFQGILVAGKGRRKTNKRALGKWHQATEWHWNWQDILILEDDTDDEETAQRSSHLAWFTTVTIRIIRHLSKTLKRCYSWLPHSCTQKLLAWKQWVQNSQPKYQANPAASWVGFFFEKIGLANFDDPKYRDHLQPVTADYPSDDLIAAPAYGQVGAIIAAAAATGAHIKMCCHVGPDDVDAYCPIIFFLAATPMYAPSLFPASILESKLPLTPVGLNGKYWSALCLGAFDNLIHSEWPIGHGQPQWSGFSDHWKDVMPLRMDDFDDEEDYSDYLSFQIGYMMRERGRKRASPSDLRHQTQRRKIDAMTEPSETSKKQEEKIEGGMLAPDPSSQVEVGSQLSTDETSLGSCHSNALHSLRTLLKSFGLDETISDDMRKMRGFTEENDMFGRQGTDMMLEHWKSIGQVRDKVEKNRSDLLNYFSEKELSSRDCYANVHCLLERLAIVVAHNSSLEDSDAEWERLKELDNTHNDTDDIIIYRYLMLTILYRTALDSGKMLHSGVWDQVVPIF